MSNRKNIIIIMSMILFFLVLLSVIFSILNMNSQRIFAGISINNIDVSGLDKDEANQILSATIKNKSEKQIKLVYNDFEYNLSFSDLNVHYNISDVINSAFNIGKDGNIVSNNYTILGTLFFKKNLYAKASFDEDSFEDFVSNLSLELPDKLIEPNYYIEDDNLVITKGTSGNVIDSEVFKDSLYSFLNNFSSDENVIQIPVKKVECSSIDIDAIHSEVQKQVQNAYYEKEPFKVHAEVVGVDFDVQNAKSLISEHPDDSEYVINLSFIEPEIKIENLDIDIFPDLLATFSTRYDASNTSRSTNLQLAADKINGTILAPGSEFSYNKVVGERSIAAGYKEAKVYSNGQVVDGIGGGICQISSTLYNAVVFANLNVTERYNHQFVTSYVSPGRDATVVYGVKDLKFVNNRTYPVKILITLNSGIAKVDLYGIKEDTEYDISFDIETLSDIKYNTLYERDSSLSDGEEVVKQAGAFGAVVNSYKVLKKSGVVISKELLSKDSYNALNRIVLTKTGQKLKD